MKPKAIFFLLFLSAMGSAGYADDGLLPPPVDVVFAAEPSDAGGVVLKLKVAALADMDVDISCLLPAGVGIAVPEGVALRPCDPADLCRDAVVLWVGPMKAAEVKEFLLSVKVSGVGPHPVVARIQALARWGTREEKLMIGSS